jgi:hypothetical protein
MYICYFDVRIPEDDPKNIETYRIVSEFYVKVYILIVVPFLYYQLQSSLMHGYKFSKYYFFSVWNKTLIHQSSEA